MKKLNLVFLTAAVLLLGQTYVNAEETLDKVTTKEARILETSNIETADTRLAEVNTVSIVEKMEARLLEINSMDFSEMSTAEKRELRKEVRSIKSEMDALAKGDAQAKAQGEEIRGSGIYISTGALIIILLLILIL
jgi:hypothetical protein